MSLKKWKSQGKAIEVTVNSKEENSEDFCLDFVKEFGLSMAGKARTFGGWGRLYCIAIDCVSLLKCVK